MATSRDTEASLEPAVESAGDRLLREIYVFELGVQRLYARDAEWGVELYKRAGTTTDLEELADHDGPAIIDGSFRRVERGDHGFPVAYHPHGGRMSTPDEEDIDDPVVLLAEVERRV